MTSEEQSEYQVRPEVVKESRLLFMMSHWLFVDSQTIDSTQGNHYDYETMEFQSETEEQTLSQCLLQRHERRRRKLAKNSSTQNDFFLSNTPVKHSCQTQRQTLSNTFRKTAKRLHGLTSCFTWFYFSRTTPFTACFSSRNDVWRNDSWRNDCLWFFLSSIPSSFELAKKTKNNMLCPCSPSVDDCSPSLLWRENFVFPALLQFLARLCFALESLSLQEENKTIIRTRVKMAS